MGRQLDRYECCNGMAASRRTRTDVSNGEGRYRPALCCHEVQRYGGNNSSTSEMWNPGPNASDPILTLIRRAWGRLVIVRGSRSSVVSERHKEEALLVVQAEVAQSRRGWCTCEKTTQQSTRPPMNSEGEGAMS